MNLKGVNIGGTIVPYSDLDRIATHDAKYGRGGWVSVDTEEEMNAIIPERREVGMVAYVISTSTPYALTINPATNAEEWVPILSSTDVERITDSEIDGI